MPLHCSELLCCSHGVALLYSRELEKTFVVFYVYSCCFEACEEAVLPLNTAIGVKVTGSPMSNFFCLIIVVIVL